MMDDLESACRQRVGSTVRRKYRLDGLLGYGAMAAVFAATHRNGSRVAIKMLHPALAHIDEIRSRFLREGYVANRIPHPGVARISDDDDDDEAKTVFLVMELLDGVTLGASLAALGGKLPVAEAVRTASRVLDVLEIAHPLGIVHRDLKPENIFLCASGEIKVLDFGIARVAELSSATRSGQIMGTPAYMAPEQASGRTREIDARTDLWAVGALLFRVLSGRDVHVASNQTVQMVYAATQPAPPIATICAHLSPALGAVIDRALLTDVPARWPHARAMLDALSAAAPQSAGSQSTIVQGSG